MVSGARSKGMEYGGLTKSRVDAEVALAVRAGPLDDLVLAEGPSGVDCRVGCVLDIHIVAVLGVGRSVGHGVGEVGTDEALTGAPFEIGRTRSGKGYECNEESECQHCDVSSSRGRGLR